MRDIEIEVGSGRIAATISGGSGPAVLLLHGFPETREAWLPVAERLQDAAQVVIADLPGYGGSSPLDPDDPSAYAKRSTASTLLAFMRELGHERFAVIGHDRGGLVAFRMALDHSDEVSHVGILDILPSVDTWDSLAGVGGVFAFHLYLLAEPSDLPERMLSAAPDVFFDHFLRSWTKVGGAIPEEVRARYLAACRRPETIRAICQGYRASAFVDPEHDAADRAAGATLRMPTLALWQDPGDMDLPFDPDVVWRSWATDLDTGPIDCGHFLPEEQPDVVADRIRDLLAR